MRRALAGSTLAGAVVAVATSCGGSPLPVDPIAPTTLAPPPIVARGWSPPAPRGPSPTFRLTSGDGQGLSFVAYRARAVVDGPIAFTDLEVSFQNPEDRTIEGRFVADLPDGASVQRLALWMGASYQEGEIVERQRARRIFESHFVTRRDPVLIERGAGSEITARVFPIFARQTKHVRIAYTEAVGPRGYVLPLARVAADHVDAQVFSGSGKQLASASGSTLATAQRDLRVPASSAAAEGLREGNDVVVRVVVPPGLERQAPAPDGRAIVVVDTSASRAGSWAATMDATRKTLRALPADVALSVIAFDQTATRVFEGSPADEADVVARLASRHPLGATRFTAALEAVEAEIARAPRPARVVFVTDGVSTLDHGASASRRLARARVDVVATGTDRNAARLGDLAASGELSSGFVVDATLGAAEIARRLAATPLRTFSVGIAGATFVGPASFSGLAEGDVAVVHATLDRPRDAIDVDVGGVARHVALAERSNTLVARAVAGARIAALEAAPETDANDAAIVSLSRTHRILSSRTALIVLETEADYARFAIPRAEEARFVTADAGVVTVEKTTRPALPDGAPTWVDPRFVDAGPTASTEKVLADTRRAGRVMTYHVARAPVVRMGATMVSGRTPPESIQRIVRQRFGQLRRCYIEEVRRAPRFEGRTLVRFVVGTDGKVRRTMAFPPSDGVDHGTFQTCVASVFLAMEFPVADYPATITVDYPIVFGHGATEEKVVALSPHVRNRGRFDVELADEETVPDVMPWLYQTPYDGGYANVHAMLAGAEVGRALDEARTQVSADPADLLAYLALGDAARARGDVDLAVRAYGSVVDVFPTRADLARVAASHLLALDLPAADDLAILALERATTDRPDRTSGFRLLALARARRGNALEALDALREAAAESQRVGSFGESRQTICEDATAIATVLAVRDPDHAPRGKAVLDELECQTLVLGSVRMLLHEESDHAQTLLALWREREHDGRLVFEGQPTGTFTELERSRTVGSHAFQVPSLADTGPSSPWQIAVRMGNAGAGSYAMGGVTVVEHDGKGNLKIEERPYVVMRQSAGVRLGTITPARPVEKLARR